MRAKHIIIICGLLVVALFSGCSQDNSGMNRQTASDEMSMTVTEMEDSVATPQDVSFSAGEETTPPIDTPQPTPTHSTEPIKTANPTQVQGKSSSPEESATPKPTASPKPASTPKPTAKPTATPKPSTTPKPTTTPNPAATPKPTPAPTPTPTPASTPEPPSVTVTPPSSGRTICNTCGADITGNVAAHGDSHLLNGENFSYRVE